MKLAVTAALLVLVNRFSGAKDTLAPVLMNRCGGARDTLHLVLMTR
jgi:hypothetical protein